MEVSGPVGSGKSALTSTIMTTAREQGLVTALFDMDFTHDPNRGGKPHIYSAPKSIEAFADACMDLCDTKAVDIIIVDTAAAASPEGSANNYDKHIPKLARALDESGTCLLMVNQFRMALKGFGSRRTPGGRLLKLYTTARIRMGKSDKTTVRGEEVSVRILMKVLKTSELTPYKMAAFNLYYDSGFGRTEDLVNIAIQLGIYRRSGRWVYDEKRVIGTSVRVAAEYLDASGRSKELSERLYSHLQL